MTETTQVASPWLTTEQLAERLHCTPQAIHNRRHKRKSLPRSIKSGNDRLYHVEDVEAWEREQREASA
jgi:hypothetical protein